MADFEQMQAEREERMQADMAQNAADAAELEQALAAVTVPEPGMVQSRAANGQFSTLVEEHPADVLLEAFRPAIDAQTNMTVKLAMVHAFHEQLRAAERVAE